MSERDTMSHVVKETFVPGGIVTTLFWPARSCYDVVFTAEDGRPEFIDPRRFHVANPWAREYYPTARDAEDAADAYHAQEVKRRSTVP